MLTHPSIHPTLSLSELKVRVVCRNRVPVSSGFGSSSAAIVGGYVCVCVCVCVRARVLFRVCVWVVR